MKLLCRLIPLGRLRLRVAMVVAPPLIGALVALPALPAVAAGNPPVTLAFASLTTEMKQPVGAQICAHKAVSGSRVFLQQQMGTLRVWRAVSGALQLTNGKCASLKVSASVPRYNQKLWMLDLRKAVTYPPS